MEEKSITQREKKLINESKKYSIRAGDTWTINDRNTAGHKSTITKVKGEEIRHIPRTHAPTTRRHNNLRLQENPRKDDPRESYILRKVQKTSIKKVGKQHKGEDIKNPIDKSVIRHLKKKDKKNK